MFDMASPIIPTRKIKAGLKVQRRASLILGIVAMIRADWRAGITPTLLNHEGLIIACLRAEFCRGGMRWRDADDAAREITGEAFKKAGAKRPSWKESQPEWTDGGVVRSHRTRCANCEGPLEWDQRIYCGKLCFDAHRARLHRADNLEAMRAAERLRRMRRANVLH